jgi:predicted aspartyl protease
MRLILRDELPFATVTFVHRGSSVDVANVLVDTGSASTLLNADIAATIGIFPEPTDRLRTLRGVGGREVVFARHIDRVEIDGNGLDQFEVEVGGMDYGFDINGILGMDFLMGAGGVIDLRTMTIGFHS